MRKIFPIVKRALYCLPFLLACFYIRSFHAEFVNNSEVRWQYVRDLAGKTYLALDVFAPSGVRVEEISSRGQDTAPSWKMINAPRWYQGKIYFPALEEFRAVLSPYFSATPSANVMYTFGWYTYLYEWQANDQPLPDESSLNIQYRNEATTNRYQAVHFRGAKVTSQLESTRDGLPIIKLTVYYPAAAYDKYQQRETPPVMAANLVQLPERGSFTLRDHSQRFYRVTLKDELTGAEDSLEAMIGGQGPSLSQVYSKTANLNLPKSARPWFDAAVLGKHAAAVVVVFYLTFILWWVGAQLCLAVRIERDGAGEKILFPIFIGILALTLVFFVIGLFQWLYVEVILVVLTVILILSLREGGYLRRFAQLGQEAALWTWQQPWRVIFLGLGAYVFYPILTYCFVPAAFIDGSGDIQNSILPIFNSYDIRHSFQAALQNSTYGQASPCLDVLKVVAYMLAGEPGLYLLGLVYVALLAAVLFLTLEKIFGVKNGLIYVTVFLFFSKDVFTDALPLAKWHVVALAFLMMALYSLRYRNHSRNFLLPALFWGVLCAQCIQLIPVFFIYVAGMIGRACFLPTEERRVAITRQIWGLEIFLFVNLVFYGKLFLETGAFLPVSLSPGRLQDFFVQINQHNENFRYIFNNYIRNFYLINKLSGYWERDWPTAFQGVIKGHDFWFLLLFLPALRNFNRTKALYLFFTVVLAVVNTVVAPNVPRWRFYFILPVVMLQCAVIASLIEWGRKLIPDRFRWFKFGVTALVTVVLVVLVLRDFSPPWPRWRYPNFMKEIPLLRTWNRTPEVRAVFWGRMTPYQYLQTVFTGVDMFKDMPYGAQNHLNYGYLIREYTNSTDMILTIPVRFHSYTKRLLTAQHDYGSVIYQQDIAQIMKDLKKLGIRYLSVMPINYVDYNPFYSPIFDRNIFPKYFQLLFSYKGSRFYKIIYDGSSRDGNAPPLLLDGLPFVPME